MIPFCPDLRTLFPEYHLGTDPAADPGSTDPWMVTLPCRYGVIYAYGRDLLAVDVDNHPAARRRLQQLGLPCVQDGDHESTFTFTLDQLPEVLAVVQPRRRRTGTPALRQHLERIGSHTLFMTA